MNRRMPGGKTGLVLLACAAFVLVGVGGVSAGGKKERAKPRNEPKQILRVVNITISEVRCLSWATCYKPYLGTGGRAEMTTYYISKTFYTDGTSSDVWYQAPRKSTYDCHDNCG